MRPVVLLALSASDLPLYRLNDVASTIIAPALSRVPGVAQVMTFGEQLYSVRVRLDPDRIAAMGLAFDTVREAVAPANSNTPVGLLQGQRQQLTLRANDQPQDAAAFGNLVVGGRAQSPIRLNEVAEVVDGVQNERIASWRDGQRALVLAVLRQPDANTVDVVDGVRNSLPALQAALPPGAGIDVMLDRSASIRASVHDVQESLVIAIGLVVLVCFLFLRRLSATLIPTVAVPISLAATFGLMWALGYGIDNVTLLGLTIAVGLVVDDAIVMLEAVVRHIEEGMAPLAGGDPRLARDRLHHHLHHPVADRGVPAHPAHGRRGGAGVQRLRRHRHPRRARLLRGVPHPDAADGQPAPRRAPPRAGGPRAGARPPRLRARLWLVAGPGAPPAASWSGSPSSPPSPPPAGWR